MATKNEHKLQDEYVQVNFDNKADFLCLKCLFAYQSLQKRKTVALAGTSDKLPCDLNFMKIQSMCHNIHVSLLLFCWATLQAFNPSWGKIPDFFVDRGL